MLQAACERSGAVAHDGVLGADLGEAPGTVAVAGRGIAGSERWKRTKEENGKVQTGTGPVAWPDRFGGAPLRFLNRLCYATFVLGTVLGAGTISASLPALPLGGCTIERDAL